MPVHSACRTQQRTRPAARMSQLRGACPHAVTCTLAFPSACRAPRSRAANAPACAHPVQCTHAQPARMWCWFLTRPEHVSWSVARGRKTPPAIEKAMAFGEGWVQWWRDINPLRRSMSRGSGKTFFSGQSNMGLVEDFCGRTKKELHYSYDVIIESFSPGPGKYLKFWCGDTGIS
ncbi:hypothetical protein GGX14DRAFT_384655 [Mycena pura]|uniref:Uncharacterized protein n=1 Tax=Mycena pura TaxID=153505 RepID=A0AAD6YW08_9AGAR|nr:hypothetical protein GGX14DRAFT_384655 [Mycena pura]